MDLFDHQREQQLQRQAPLAERLRPQSLDDFIGQEDILGPGRLLRRAIAADRLGSLIFHGPPGTGKTTLARIIANSTRCHFSSLNAVLAGIKELRAEIEQARERLGRHGLRSLLFIDEVHRFNTAQQDALLPWVENGTVTLIGATTENPFFEVNKALVSRSRLFRLQPLGHKELQQVLDRALNDQHQGDGQELGFEHQPQGRGLEEGQHQKQGRMDRVTGGDHAKGCKQQHRGKGVKQSRLNVHKSAAFVHRYLASAALFAAISAS